MSPLRTALALALTLASCAPAVRVATETPKPAATPRTLRGRVTYEARTLTPHGYSQAPETHPARYVVVEARDARQRVLATTETDALGAFSFTAPADQVTRVVARSIVTHRRACAAPSASCFPTVDMRVTRDPAGRTAYTLPADVPPTGDAPLLLHASLAEPESLGGAFHILDTLVLGAHTVYQWSGRELAPFFTIWSHASGTDWSYYRGERPAGSGHYALELMGGERDSLATSDADEHDVYIVLHEYGHFVFDQLSSDSSIAGMHPATVQIDPGVAWEEGRATWFACAVLRDSRYRDAVGIEPSGTLRQDDDLEQLPANALRGLGSQRSVEEILWDLSDGALADGSAPLADRDNDGTAVGPAGVFTAMMALRDVHDTVPSLLTLMHGLVASGRVTEAQAGGLLQRPVSHGFALPASVEGDPWPIRLAPGVSFADKVDGVTDPAPSGGRANPVNGFDAVRVYRVLVPAGGRRLRATVRIAGTGTSADASNLRVELRDGRAELLTAGATRNGATRGLEASLDAGVYLLLVRDAGTGNRASFSVQYELVAR